MLVHAPERGSRLPPGETFLCIRCLDVRPCVDESGKRQFVREGEKTSLKYTRREGAAALFLSCLPCRAVDIRARALRDGRISYHVVSDIMGRPLTVGDWGGVETYPVLEATQHATKKDRSVWRLYFTGPDDRLWEGAMYTSERRIKRSYDTFAYCKRVR